MSGKSVNMLSLFSKEETATECMKCGLGGCTRCLLIWDSVRARSKDPVLLTRS